MMSYNPSIFTRHMNFLNVYQELTIVLQTTFMRLSAECLSKISCRFRHRDDIDDDWDPTVLRLLYELYTHYVLLQISMTELMTRIMKI